MPRYKRFQPIEQAPVFAPPVEETPKVPADWTLGALLNVRVGGAGAVITLYPEEASYEHPERTLRFSNMGECQDFVSRWYAREHHDPRA